jgi:hypothetical protein
MVKKYSEWKKSRQFLTKGNSSGKDDNGGALGGPEIDPEGIDLFKPLPYNLQLQL